MKDQLFSVKTIDDLIRPTLTYQVLSRTNSTILGHKFTLDRINLDFSIVAK